MTTPSTMRRLLTLVHEYAAEPAPTDSDAATQRDLDYFDRMLGILGYDAGEPAADTPGEYCVRWLIDVPAASHLHAARQARHIQLRPDSSATVFDVALRGAGDEPDWSHAESIDLTAYRADEEVVDEIADLLRTGEPPNADDIAQMMSLIRLTGRDLG